MENKKARSLSRAGLFVFQKKDGVPLWSVVEPLWLDFDVAAPSTHESSSNNPKRLESKEKVTVTRLELETKLERLVGREKRSIEQASAEVGVSLTTVRRVCRTLGLGRYAPEALKKGPASRSSQVPFGWVVEHGVLRENPAEMKWVLTARDMRAKGQSYHAIARYLQERGVPTKNGGRWHARTIIQILDLNDRIPGKPTLKSRSGRR